MICEHTFVPDGGWIVSKGAYSLGIELEVERNPEEIDERLGDRFVLKQDASLNDGVEIVTHAMSLCEHKRMWPSVLRTLQKLKCRVHNYTGLHVHISTDREHFESVLRFILQNRGIIKRICGRRENGFVAWDKQNDHYAVLNQRGDGHFEFRAPKATLDVTEFLGRVELAQALVRFGADCKDWKEFIGKVRRVREYKELRILMKRVLL